MLMLLVNDLQIALCLLGLKMQIMRSVQKKGSGVCNLDYLCSQNRPLVCLPVEAETRWDLGGHHVEWFSTFYFYCK